MDDDEFDDLFSFGPNTTATSILASKTTNNDNNDDDKKANNSIDDELSELLEVKTTTKTKTDDDDDDDVFGSFQQNDESTRDILDWLDQGGNSGIKDINDGDNDEIEDNNIVDNDDDVVVDNKGDADNIDNNDSLSPPASPKTTKEEAKDDLELTPTKTNKTEPNNIEFDDDFELTPARIKKAINADKAFDFEKDILGDDEDEEEGYVNIKKEELGETPTIAKIPEETKTALMESSSNISSSTNSTNVTEETKEVEENEKDYDTLHEALTKSKSLKIISTLFQEKAHCEVSTPEERQMLWCKFICNNGSMTIEELENSNIADAYSTWKHEQKQEQEVDESNNVIAEEIQLCITKDISLFSSSLDNEKDDDQSTIFQSILTYYYQNNTKQHYDKHVSSILSILIKAGYNDKCCITLLLQHIYPNYMPLMALDKEERKDALKVLHTQFYLLCTYHLPLVVIHLDKYIQGWYLQEHIDHWFLCLFASIQHNNSLLQLWDRLLVFMNNNDDHSIIFFFALTILNQSTESIILLTDKTELQETLSSIFTLQSFEDMQLVQEDAIFLKQSTPKTILTKLKTLEKDVLTNMLIRRNKKIERKSKLQLELRPKLVKYYETYNPEKVEKVDVVLQLFDGRYDELDTKLRNKYGGHGLYDIALAGDTGQKLAVTSKLFSGIRKNTIEKEHKLDDDIDDTNTLSQVCVQIKPEEVFPILLSSHTTLKTNNNNNNDMKFILVDSRLEETAKTQGRFPTSISIPPDTLNNTNESLTELDTTFESMRGAVHIVVMGEGISSLTNIYKNYTIDEADKALEEDDISRTSLCALYFIKKGFPFVSILQGGFASAYVYLARSPAFLTKLPSLLMDYDPSISLVARLEAAYIEECRYKSASTKEKTVIKLQNFMDNSMSKLTVTQQKIESFAVEESSKKRDVMKYFKKNIEEHNKEHLKEQEINEEQKETASSKLTRIFRPSSTNPPSNDDLDVKDDNPASSTTSRFSNWKRNIPSLATSTSSDNDTVSTDSTTTPATPTEQNAASKMTRFRNMFNTGFKEEQVDDKAPTNNDDIAPDADATDITSPQATVATIPQINDNSTSTTTTRFWKKAVVNPFSTKTDKVVDNTDVNDLSLETNNNDSKKDDSTTATTEQKDQESSEVVSPNNSKHTVEESSNVKETTTSSDTTITTATASRFRNLFTKKDVTNVKDEQTSQQQQPAADDTSTTTTATASRFRNLFTKKDITTTTTSKKQAEYSEPEECISFPDEEDNFVNNNQEESDDTKSSLFQMISSENSQDKEEKTSPLFPVISNDTKQPSLFPVVSNNITANSNGGTDIVNFLDDLGGELIDDDDGDNNAGTTEATTTASLENDNDDNNDTTDTTTATTAIISDKNDNDDVTATDSVATDTANNPTTVEAIKATAD